MQTVDLYYIHFPFTLLSVEELMDLMAESVEAGKIRAVGVSNFKAKQMRRAATRVARYNIPLAANQDRYNLMHRQPEENGALDACRELNVALVAYRPLERGQLKSDTAPRPSSRSPMLTNRKTKASSKVELLQGTLEEIAEQCGRVLARSL